jgi:hypothetical protein
MQHVLRRYFDASSFKLYYPCVSSRLESASKKIHEEACVVGHIRRMICFMFKLQSLKQIRPTTGRKYCVSMCLFVVCGVAAEALARTRWTDDRDSQNWRFACTHAAGSAAGNTPFTGSSLRWRRPSCHTGQAAQGQHRCVRTRTNPGAGRHHPSCMFTKCMVYYRAGAGDGSR